MNFTIRRAALPLASLTLVLAVAPALAQSPRWTTDYNVARREAAETGRPIAVEFGTESCLWCKKLDAGPLRDPAVAAMLGERFICLRVDAEREPGLTAALQVNIYPTIILAGPDGKILGNIEGYVEAPRLLEQLQKAQGIVCPEWMLRDFQEAAKAVAASDYSRGIALLKSITKDGQERPIQVKSRKVLADLETQASGRLARAKSLQDKGQNQEAVETLTDLLKSYTGTHAAVDGAGLLKTLAATPELKSIQRARRARELLAQARDDFRSEQFLGCLERCEILANAYSDLPESAEAQKLSTEIKDNPEFLSKAVDTLNHRTGSLYLALAESWIKKGQPAQAQVCLEKAMLAAPGSRQAESAQTRLAQLQGRTTNLAEYKKP